MRRVSSWIVATPSVGCGVTSSPFNGRSPPLEEKVARTVSNDFQRSIPPCACSTEFKSSVTGTLLSEALHQDIGELVQRLGRALQSVEVEGHALIGEKPIAGPGH